MRVVRWLARPRFTPLAVALALIVGNVAGLETGYGWSAWHGPGLIGTGVVIGSGVIAGVIRSFGRRQEETDA